MSILTLNNLCKLLIFTFLSSLFSCHDSSRHTPTNLQIPAHIFRSADIALRLGRSIESDLIARSGDRSKSYSHIGLIIESDSGLIVVDIEPKTNSTSDKIKAQRIEDFFSSRKSLSGAVLRYNFSDSLAVNRLKTKCIESLNSTITFDYDYCLSDSTRMYCTELIEHIYQSTGFSLSEDRRHSLPLAAEAVILPSDIALNDNLTEIWSYDLRFEADSLR